MTESDFRDFLKKLAVYYNQKNIVTDERFDMWFRMVRHISLESLNFIKYEIFEDRNIFPANLPKAMQEAWVKYKHEKGIAKKTDSFKIKPCKDCGGTGLLIAYVLGENSLRYQRKMFVCAACDNYLQHFNSLSLFTAGQEIRLTRILKHDLLARNFVAGLDGDMATIYKVRDLNQMISEKNKKSYGVKYA